MDQKTADLPVGDPKKLRNNTTVLKCLFPDGHITAKKASPAGLTAACIALSKQNVQTVKNQRVLQEQNKALATRLERLETIVLDHLGEDGKLQDGLARTVFHLTNRFRVMEKQSSAFLLNANVVLTFLREYLPTFWDEHKRIPNSIETEAAVDAIMKKLVAEGDRAAEISERLRELSNLSVRCAMCVHWKEASRIVVPGIEPTKEHCEQPGVQLYCAGCGKPHEEPVDPNDVKGKCAACGAELAREQGEGQDARTLCMLFTPDRMRWRDLLASEKIPQELIDEMFPAPIEVSVGSEPGDPGVAVPRS